MIYVRCVLREILRQLVNKSICLQNVSKDKEQERRKKRGQGKKKKEGDRCSFFYTFTDFFSRQTESSWSSYDKITKSTSMAELIDLPFSKYPTRPCFGERDEYVFPFFHLFVQVFFLVFLFFSVCFLLFHIVFPSVSLCFACFSLSVFYFIHF